MRAVVQRVSSAGVTVDGTSVGEIGAGLCILLGIARDDGVAEAAALARKIAHLRIFANAGGRFDLSLLDVDGSALVVSQFTLLASTARGNRPDFGGAAEPQLAETLYERFIEELRAEGVPVETGRFGATMALEILNDGPVTLVIER